MTSSFLCGNFILLLPKCGRGVLVVSENNFNNTFFSFSERKLKAIKSKNKVVENLAAYRADCIDRLMREGCDLDPVIGDTEDEKLLQE